MIFKDLSPGQYCIFQGWVLLKIRAFGRYNAVILNPVNRSSVDTSEVTGSLANIDDLEKVEVK